MSRAPDAPLTEASAPEAPAPGAEGGLREIGSPAWAAVAARLGAEAAAGHFAQPWPEDLLVRLLADRAHGGFLAIDGRDRPCGLILMRSVTDEAELLQLAVVPDARRRGWGRRLLSAGLGWAAERGAARCFLEVAADNGPALALYEAAGFRAVGRRPGYYGAVEPDGRPGTRDAIVMALELRR